MVVKTSYHTQDEMHAGKYGRFQHADNEAAGIYLPDIRDAALGECDDSP
jgi:hypothetical protein